MRINHLDLMNTYGKDEGILLFHLITIINYVRKFRKSSIKSDDGRTWIFLTYRDVTLVLTFYTRREVRYVIQKLLAQEILLMKTPPLSKKNQGNWYALKDEKLFFKTSSNK